MTIRIQQIISSSSVNKPNRNASVNLTEIFTIKAFTHVAFYNDDRAFIHSYERDYSRNRSFNIVDITERTGFYIDPMHFYRFEAFYKVCKANMEMYQPKPF